MDRKRGLVKQIITYKIHLKDVFFKRKTLFPNDINAAGGNEPAGADERMRVQAQPDAPAVEIVCRKSSEF